MTEETGVDSRDRGEKGKDLLLELMGQPYLDQRAATDSSFNAPLRQFSDENCFGDTWLRPGLDRKTRSLILLSALLALNRMPQFAAHVRSAINNGASVIEIQEVLYQCISYLGLPVAADGFQVAERVLKEMGKL